MIADRTDFVAFPTTVPMVFARRRFSVGNNICLIVIIEGGESRERQMIRLKRADSPVVQTIQIQIVKIFAIFCRLQRTHFDDFLLFSSFFFNLILFHYRNY